MKVLVTGGAGFVGTNLIKRLLKDDYEVVSVDNYSTGKKENHQKGCTYFDYDISSEHTLGIYVDHQNYPSWREVDYDIIFHVGALARIQPSLKDPMTNIKNNVLSTLHMIELAKKNNTPIVYAGSSSKHHAPYGSAYAWSKYAGEQLCKLYTECYDLPTAVCRFYNVYGPHQLVDGDYATVLGIFERQYKNNEPLTITDKGEQRRDFTHVDDIVDGLIKCGRSLLIPNAYHAKVSGEEFELGSGVNHSINEVADMFGKDYPRKYVPARKGEYDKTLCTDDKAHKLLGWKPTRTLQEYIEDFLETERFLNE
jgi:UDP-glucose 4-epimerase|tara:strand:- start:432 stop:1361 length:930 start_codon:yes stop_codon:yes gene_type:complete